MDLYAVHTQRGLRGRDGGLGVGDVRRSARGAAVTALSTGTAAAVTSAMMFGVVDFAIALRVAVPASVVSTTTLVTAVTAAVAAAS
jgi:hypothetical protein